MILEFKWPKLWMERDRRRGPFTRRRGWPSVGECQGRRGRRQVKRPETRSFAPPLPLRGRAWEGGLMGGGEGVVHSRALHWFSCRGGGGRVGAGGGVVLSSLTRTSGYGGRRNCCRFVYLNKAEPQRSESPPPRSLCHLVYFFVCSTELKNFAS